MQLIRKIKEFPFIIEFVSIIIIVSVFTYSVLTYDVYGMGTSELKIDLTSEKQLYQIYRRGSSYAAIRPLTDETRDMANAICKAVSPTNAFAIGEYLLREDYWDQVCMVKLKALTIFMMEKVCESVGTIFARFEKPSTLVCREKGWEDVGAKQKA